ncbi:tyrosine-type recombinase/integrase [Bradyrhizobium barranii]
MPAKKWTRDRVESEKPGAARREVPDAACPGLYLIVQPSGAKSWAFRYVIAGATRKLTLGQYPAVTLEAARADAATARGEVANGRDPAGVKAETRKAAPANTVLAAFRDYDRGHLSWGRNYVDPETGEVTPAETDSKGNPVEAKIGADTASATRSFFVRRVLPVWGRRAVGSITRQDCVSLLDALSKFKDARRKGKTRLSHFFGWTMDRNATVKANPAAGIQTQTADSRERKLSDEELRAVWLACDQLGNFGALVRTLMLTMARRNEAARMDRAELSATLWSVEGNRTKNRLPMDWHRTPQLNAIIEPLLKKSNSPFVFEGRHHDRPMGGFSDYKAKLDAITGDAVAPWTLHDLRRTSRSLMQRLKIPLEVRRACSNHVSSGVDGTYDRHAYAAEKVTAFEALAREIDRIVSRQSANVVPLTRPAAEPLTIASL